MIPSLRRSPERKIQLLEDSSYSTILCEGGLVLIKIDPARIPAYYLACGTINHDAIFHVAIIVQALNKPCKISNGLVGYSPWVI
jgi:hypothetical protein